MVTSFSCMQSMGSSDQQQKENELCHTAFIQSTVKDGWIFFVVFLNCGGNEPEVLLSPTACQVILIIL